MHALPVQQPQFLHRVLLGRSDSAIVCVLRVMRSDSICVLCFDSPNTQQCLMWLLQGRLPEIEVLQKQISKAHEELSDLRFKLDEQRAAAASKEQQHQANRQQLESQLEAATHQKERLQLEASAATTRATQHEKQLEELYELCTTQQGETQAKYLCC